MNELSVFAPVKGPEGYSVLARDFVCQAHQRGIRVCLEEFQHWGPWTIELAEYQHIALGTALRQKPSHSASARTKLSICLPQQVKPEEPCLNVNYTMFETDRICPEWVDALQQVDEVLVPTQFNRAGFAQSGVPIEKIGTLPIGYDSDRFHPGVEPLDLKIKGRSISEFPIRILIVCEHSPRKNLQGALQLLYRISQTLGTDNVCGILKVGNYSSRVTAAEQISFWKSRWIEEGSILDLPYNVFNYTPLLSDDLHARFLAMGTHYLSLSLGEGWDLTALQAAALGLGLIVPYSSAYQCWLDLETIHAVPIAAKHPAFSTGRLNHLYANSHWSIPHQLDALGMIVSNLKDQRIDQQKRALLQKAVTRYSWDSIFPQWASALHLT